MHYIEMDCYHLAIIAGADDIFHRARVLWDIYVNRRLEAYSHSLTRSL
jgi:hypothetical protein